MLLQRRLRVDYERFRIYDSIPEVNRQNNMPEEEAGSQEESDLTSSPGLPVEQEPAPTPETTKEPVYTAPKPRPFPQDPRYFPKGTGDPELDKIIELAGYDYDQPQDIFYSVLNPWQRNVGYSRLYDEAAAPLGMIMDCEPIYFDYDNRKWMISFWKGQYDLVCGGEVGIYTGGLQLDIPDIFTGTFYNSVNDAEMLPISYTLKKNGETLFTRSDRHWWLTGFKLGEFAQPSELTLETSLTFPNSVMRDAFLGGFKKAGYQEHEYAIDGNTVSFVFDTPHTPQPTTRTPATDEIIQEKNRLLCEMYQNLTREGQSTPEKLKILKKEAPELYDQALKLGSNQQFFQVLYVLIITAMYLLTAFSSGSSSDKNYLSRKKDEILNKLKQKIEKLPVR